MRFLWLACMCACGAAPATTTNTTPLPSASATVAKSETTRAPSPAMVRMWPFEQARMLLYVDIAGARKTPLGGAIPDLVNAVAGSLGASTERTRCFNDVVAASSEFVAGGGNIGSTAGALWIAHYDPSRFASARACLSDAAAGHVDGASETWIVEKTLVATTASGFLAWGPRELVEAALHGDGHSTDLAQLTLRPDVYARVIGDVNRMHVEARVALSETHFVFDAATVAPEEATRTAVADFDEAKSKFAKMELEGEAALALTRLLKAATLERKGPRLHFTLDLAEPPKQQAFDVGIAASISIHAIRRYLTLTKEAEAKNTASAIAKNIVASWEREELPPVPANKKKLRSFPPVPKLIPHGNAVTGDWSAWAPLKFEMSEPQRYQYEVRAAPDGMSADVTARGDLNGDGKTSLFVIHVTVDKATRSLKVSDE